MARNTPYHVNLNGGFSGHNNPGAAVWYVGAQVAVDDGATPSDGNDGRSPQQALATIQAALDKCVAGRGDIVAILPGSYTITAALDLSKADVSVVAAHPVPPGVQPNVTIVCATDSISMVEIEADNVTFGSGGIRLDHNTTTAAVPLIDVGDSGARAGVLIEDVFLDMEGSATDTDGIRLGDGTNAVTNSLVQRCTIHDYDQDGVVISAGSDENVVRDNIIRDSVTANTGRYGINCAGDGCHLIGNDINTLTSTGACIYANGTLIKITNNRLFAGAANTIGILAAASATLSAVGDVIHAVAAGNIADFTTAATSPSAVAGTGVVYAADPAQGALITPTVDGS